MSKQNTDIDKFFKEIKNTKDIEGLDEKLSGLYLVEKNSKTEFKKEN